MQHILISCEHGGNEIPDAYKGLFKGQEEMLASHRGWDIGALQVANAIGDALNISIYYATISRLVVELNRSLHHPNLFSKFTKPLSLEEKTEILRKYYFPYRNKVIAGIENQINKGSDVIHLSIHSFTPILDGKVREADFGLLYDPEADGERAFSKQLKTALKECSNYRVRYNYPYKGKADGFTTFLRKKFPKNYSGIEVEINQQLLEDHESMNKVIACFQESLKSLG